MSVVWLVLLVVTRNPFCQKRNGNEQQDEDACHHEVGLREEIQTEGDDEKGHDLRFLQFKIICIHRIIIRCAKLQLFFEKTHFARKKMNVAGIVGDWKQKRIIKNNTDNEFYE